jgi:AraC-like DNA-binding protein
VQQGIVAVFEAPVADRMAALLQVLRVLAEDRGAGQLASQMPPETAKGRGRIDRVLSHIHVEYHRAVALRELAEIAALSTSGLHRQFRAQTGQTISGYVAQLRVGEACARLSGGRAPIAHIAGEVGYPSLANFNRQFLRLKGMTPRAYRAHFQAG